MSMRILWVSCVMAICGLGLAGPAAAQCEPEGETRFVCGPISPEDLALVPETPWVIVASWEDDGYLSAADSRDGSTVRLFPTATVQGRHNAAMYADCPGVSTGGFRAHGISLRSGTGGTHVLYVVRHGAREAVEVFEVDARGAEPSLTWTGCAVAPDGLGLNAVVALPDGGFAATSPRTRDIWEWHPDTAWVRVPGSEDIGPNGIEVSSDGRWFLVAGYASQSVIRLSRGQTPVQQTRVEVGFNIDNVHWAPDGTLLAAGHTAPSPTGVGDCIARRGCAGIVSFVARVDTDTMTQRQILRYPTDDRLILGTTAIEVADELWVGQVAGGTHILRIPLR
ncbi:MAG: hypothetical protein OSB03_02585 [Vicinamibacterales bacterium]|nr:hypothetical protein [Vicinamibacterales bacterium]